jgi:hypothetical protein
MQASPPTGPEWGSRRLHSPRLANATMRCTTKVTSSAARARRLLAPCFLVSNTRRCDEGRTCACGAGT